MMASDSQMYSEARAWFVMYSPNLDTKGVLRQTGIVPSYQWSVGDKLRRGMIVHKNSGFELQSALDKSANLEDHFKALLQLIRDKSTILVELADKYQAEIVFLGEVWSYNSDRPEMHFSKDVVKEIARIGASIGMDLYAVRDE